MDVSVIITTYNHPQWLEWVIRGYAQQTYRQFEIVIADDGSGERTRTTIERLREETQLPIRHLWQADQGFRKCEILNKAIASSAHPYLIFTDGDCLPRRDFVAQHVRLARPGRFLSGGVVHLPKPLSDRIDQASIESGNAFDWRWLRQHGLPWSRKRLLLTRALPVGTLLDCVTTTRPTFNGHNASVWKSDVVRVNGFDERMAYGGLDRELGERLENVGIRGKQIRHRAIAIHLHHTREYATADGRRANDAIRRQTHQTHRSWTEQGLDQHLAKSPHSAPRAMSQSAP